MVTKNNQNQGLNNQDKAFSINKKVLIIYTVAIVFLGITSGLLAGYSFGLQKGQGDVKKIFDISDTLLTANEAYKVAMVKAKAWQDDAGLASIRLIAPSVDNDGKSSSWEMAFYSVKSKSGYKVLIKDGNIASSQGIALAVTDTLKGAWLDSPIVLERVLNSSGDESPDIKDLNLSYFKNEHKWIWSVNYKKGNITVIAEK
ncbi:hypothetical protein COX95_03445 [bacterium CG_4_10_14_0_2_um_filter_33_32]|nr:MAG: hypothetical protein AUJ93_04845 [bacterium CG2_30_33_46]PIR67532.1 MAG: hypothetical protein COU50_02780 [bacterium CG10_big_fil_rev_8_21_14_0_10_33_18]PIU77067.1 MAG: hypothetical protein COS74_00900 [bacterium CG06_land_8_20_14_3_00_33_50]PIW80909.1 MAG: hypothetical protein COZ97_04370 [bacterium CG_4_8_14_3_um_filter_33_28]PIY85230.1 MAG: hypothetical protein COY76_03255 [bacterium CG_4_10_14_0_8_um_filter_33_57]PIZ85620.1 MAG: hypothetical protein COX95_03445 [bacterium CG_4_10_1